MTIQAHQAGEARVRAIPSKRNKDCFILLDGAENRSIRYGVVEEAKSSFDQLRSLPKKFVCGVVLPQDMSVDDRFFSLLIGCGCRGISILGLDSRRAEDSFDQAAIATLRIDTIPDSKFIWSSSHLEVGEFISTLIAMAEKFPIYLLEIGGSSTLSTLESMIRR